MSKKKKKMKRHQERSFVSRLNPHGTSILLLIFLSFAAHFNVLFNEFVYDEIPLVMENKWIKNVKFIPDIFTSSLWAVHFEESGHYYRPIIHLLYMLDYHLFGLAPWGYHLTKLMLHTLNVVLVYLIADFIISRNKESIFHDIAPVKHVPIVTAIFFALHPVHVEVVAISIAESAFSLFFLLAFLFYIRAQGSYLASYFLSAFFFLVALLSKETAIVFPAVVFLYDYIFGAYRGVKDAIKRYAIYFVVVGGYFPFRSAALGGFIKEVADRYFTFFEILINIPPLFSKYVFKMFMPVGLNAAYVFHPVTGLTDARLIGSLLFISLCSYFLFRLWKTDKLASFSLLWFFLAITPAFYIPALGEHAFAERYLYLPSVGFFLFFSYFFLKYLGPLFKEGEEGRGRAALPVFMLLSGVLIFLSLTRVSVWKDSLSLWSDTAKKSPGAYLARVNYGVALHDAGRSDEAVSEYMASMEIKFDSPLSHLNLANIYVLRNKYEEALEEYEISLRYAPKSAQTFGNIANTYALMKNYEEAMKYYKKAIDINPNYAKIQNNYGRALLSFGKYEEALDAFIEAAALKPNVAKFHSDLAKAYSKLGERQEAARELILASILDPEFGSPRYILSVIYLERNELEVAEAGFKTVIVLDPNHAKARNNLGLIYLNTFRLDLAIEELQKAVVLDSGYIDAYYNLGLAYKMSGRSEEARTALKRVLELEKGHKGAKKSLEALSS